MTVNLFIYPMRDFDGLKRLFLSRALKWKPDMASACQKTGVKRITRHNSDHECRTRRIEHFHVKMKEWLIVNPNE